MRRATASPPHAHSSARLGDVLALKCPHNSIHAIISPAAAAALHAQARPCCSTAVSQTCECSALANVIVPTRTSMCPRVHTQTGALLLEKQVHDDAIQDMQLSPDGAYAITASLDKTSKLIDLDEFEVRPRCMHRQACHSATALMLSSGTEQGPVTRHFGDIKGSPVPSSDWMM